MAPALLFAAWMAAATASPSAAPIRLFVDLRDAPTRVVHVTEILPAGAGRIDLLYPKWIPGEHSPSGTIDDVANLEIGIDRGSDLVITVPWRRDSLDMNEFHLELPAGTRGLNVHFDLLGSGGTSVGSSAASYTSQLGILSWN